MIHCYVASFSQQDTSIYKTFGGEFEDKFHSAFYDNDSNLVFCGVTSSLDNFGSKAYLVKTDTLLNHIWSITYGDTGSSSFSDVIQKDDGYLVLGRILNPSTSYDISLVYFNKDGNIIWDKKFGTSNWDLAESISPVADGYIITGKTFGFSGGGDGYLIKLDHDGELIWEKNFDFTSDEGFYDGRESVNGNYILGGEKKVSEDLIVQWFLVTDSDGNIILERTFGDANENRIYSVATDPFGESYYIAGELYSSETETIKAYLAKIDDDGALVWDRVFNEGNTEGTQKWLDLELGRFTELICTGFTLNGGFGDAGDDILSLRVTRSGIFIDQKTYGTPNNEKGFHGIRIHNAYILAGFTDGLGNGQNDAFVIRTRNNASDDDYSTSHCDQDNSGQVTSISDQLNQIDQAYFDSNSNSYINKTTGTSTQVFSVSGRMVYEFVHEEPTHQINLEAGFYIIKAKGENALPIIIR